MTDGGKKQKRRLGMRNSRSRIGQRLATLLGHPQMAGIRGALDITTARLERLERRLPPPLKSPVVRRRLLWLGVIVGGIGAAKLISWQIDRSLPDPAEIQTFARRGTLTIRASDGTVLHQLGAATREKLTIDQMPKQLIDAFVASEDRRFYEHNGIDIQGIGRAIARNITSGGLVEGGSTLTQQLSRIVYLNQDRSIVRKVREAMIAQKLERSVAKRQLLEKYLNLVYLGSNAYGVGDAAWIYFSKSVNQLSLSEAATIAGLPPAPSVYSPLEDLEKAQQRRNNVLDKMVEAGYISVTEAQAAKAEDLTVKPSEPKKIQSDAPYFTYYVQQQLPNYVSKEAIEAGGLTVETTLNATWQKAAEKAVKETIEVDGSAASFKQASLVAIDPRNGEIRSMVGGYDFYKESQFNRATQAQRQPGSTFKPFVYTAAIAAGFSPHRSYLDERFKVDGYQPKNYSNKYSGWMSIKSALTNSINVVAVKTLIDVGFSPVIRMAQNMGIHSKLEPTYALSLGAYEVNLLELTSAYGALAAQGNTVDPHGIRRIVDRKGNVLYQSEYKSKRAIDPGTASIMTWMLRGVVTDGTGRAAQLDRPVAGKTGTSEKARDLWFIGFIPQVVTGVWLGNDDNSPTWGASSTAAFTWHEFMKEVVKGMPVQNFPDVADNFDTRKGSIKAQPVKPSRIQSLGAGADPEESSRDRRYEEAPAEPSYEEPSYSAPAYSEPEDPEPAYPEPPPEPAAAEPPPEPEQDAPPVAEEAPPEPEPAPVGSDPLPPS
ncbi:PBP1A family penicillin-binding protein [Myxacorys almedinensis A]|uniref:PBP1A family penicillin-binding protein n=2 Tax=Myxacorys TaxID=2056239 RepID=A0A8J8CMH3_9CYAN|nr:PBP1A family penicillin-binding protein [Myxacorys almedinensis A]